MEQEQDQQQELERKRRRRQKQRRSRNNVNHDLNELAKLANSGEELEEDDLKSFWR